ncbi:MFS general substrate transporter [Microthyrium microscopicum]|uniref:MFS general substrate transporter n=1 Tax=Microthyrium microscopicum TaxID=703497 RepID=A0A6A6UNC0_9PEZI|nr:MFS general substrate transporter [Microthyrium microscopicum]
MKANRSADSNPNLQLEAIDNSPAKSSGYEIQERDDYFQPITGKEQRDIENAILLRRTTTDTTTRAQLALAAIRGRKVLERTETTQSFLPSTGPDVIVDFEGDDDPYRPQNWPFKQKCITTLLYGLTTLGASFASAVYQPCIHQVRDQFKMNRDITRLGTALLMFGLGMGPLLWAPISEFRGRKETVLIPYFIAAIFAVSGGASKDIETLLICRFFMGFFASAPMCITGGVLKDIWSPTDRGIALVGYGLSVLTGPLLGPIVGGAIVSSPLGWRWTQYITGIWMFTMLGLDLLLLDESFPPALLVSKARKLRFETGNYALHAKHEEMDFSPKELAHKYLVRPWIMMCTPILFCVALYSSFVYGIMYANLGAFPVVFQEGREWNAVIGALPFISVLLGVLIAAGANIANQGYFKRTLIANNNKPLPEARLPPMMAGSVVFAAGLFIFAWTSSPHIHWMWSQLGAACVGFGFFTIIQPGINYIVDTFTESAASAIAALTFVRSAVAGGLPLVIVELLRNLGIPKGISLFGGIAVAMIPIPFFFFFFESAVQVANCNEDVVADFNACVCTNGGNFLANAYACINSNDPGDLSNVYSTMVGNCAYSNTPVPYTLNQILALGGSASTTSKTTSTTAVAASTLSTSTTSSTSSSKSTSSSNKTSSTSPSSQSASTSTTGSAAASSSSGASSSKPLSKGAIAGASIGGIVGGVALMGLLAAGLLCCKRKKRKATGINADDRPFILNNNDRPESTVTTLPGNPDMQQQQYGYAGPESYAKPANYYHAGQQNYTVPYNGQQFPQYAHTPQNNVNMSPVEASATPAPIHSQLH